MSSVINFEYEEIGLDYQDAGPWRSYMICAVGKDLDDLMRGAEIQEVDQDGRTLRSYELSEGPVEVQNAAFKFMKKKLESRI